MADGSLTPDPVENIYSGIVSLRHLRLVIFLGELNNLELWQGDIGNSYLEAYTLLEGVVATQRTSGQTVCPRVCSYVLVTLEVNLARN